MSRISMLAVGYDNTCAVRDGETGLWCWGSNRFGQLGVPGDGYVFTPTALFHGRVIRSVSAGLGVICAITGPEVVECLGSDNHFAVSGARALGDNEYPSRYRSVFVGPLSFCAVSVDHRAFCWGDNNVGQLRRDTLGDRIARPIWMADDVSSIAVETSYSCAVLLDGGVRCWGRDFSDDSSRVPLRPEVGPVRGIAMGALTTWLLNDTGEIWPLGQALSGTAGITPASINTTFRARAITAGFSHACALADDGGVWCWGSNQYGEVGTSQTPSRVPERVFP